MKLKVNVNVALKFKKIKMVVECSSDQSIRLDNKQNMHGKGCHKNEKERKKIK